MHVTAMVAFILLWTLLLGKDRGFIGSVIQLAVTLGSVGWMLYIQCVLNPAVDRAMEQECVALSAELGIGVYFTTFSTNPQRYKQEPCELCKYVTFTVPVDHGADSNPLPEGGDEAEEGREISIDGETLEEEPLALPVWGAG